jgi:hypothetical protein
MANREPFGPVFAATKYGNETGAAAGDGAGTVTCDGAGTIAGGKGRRNETVPFNLCANFTGLPVRA